MYADPQRKVWFEDWGLIPYPEAFQKQLSFFEPLVAQKLEAHVQHAPHPTQNYIFTCQHPHVITLGRSGQKENLLLSPDELEEKHISYFPTSRGGDITYHGPGQLVVYPIVDLDHFFTDIHKYMRLLEECVIQTVADFGIHATRMEGLTGVWIKDLPMGPAKICAMGVKTSRWVTMHGLAINVNTDLTYFDHIVPCGIKDKSVTSIQDLLQKEVSMAEVQDIFLDKFQTIFDCELYNYQNSLP